jgi:hypothetical protein
MGHGYWTRVHRAPESVCSHDPASCWQTREKKKKQPRRVSKMEIDTWLGMAWHPVDSYRYRVHIPYYSPPGLYYSRIQNRPRR